MLDFPSSSTSPEDIWQNDQQFLENGLLCFKPFHLIMCTFCTYKDCLLCSVPSVRGFASFAFYGLIPPPPRSQSPFPLFRATWVFPSRTSLRPPSPETENPMPCLCCRTASRSRRWR